MRLADFSSAVRQFSAPFADAYDDLVARLKSADAGAGAPRPGEAMPPFLLPDENNRLVAFEELIKEGPVVITFNRGHWCEYCQIELAAFKAALGEFAKTSAQVVSIMPETNEYLSSLEPCRNFRFLADVDNGYALEVGLAIWLGDAVRDLYLKHGIELQRYNRSDSWFLPIPATFVVGRDCVIIDRFVDPDFRDRMEIEDILKALGEALQ
ncbi:peroxiredoxin-like family protein [Hyphomicrobium sp.]|uniref:peroxiredoxin-like family protein n=1 Tax=Hyphomicrobium sp. TaxID=82 RepID=UPI0025C1F23D|nr:peroxiredoxin-like family protein [Hyphomicrobium sp.]